MKKIFLIILLVLMTIFAILLIVENGEQVTFKFYFIEKALPLYAALILPFVLGLIMGVLIMSLSVMKNKFRVGKTQRQLNKVEKEVQSLRAAPLPPGIATVDET